VDRLIQEKSTIAKLLAQKMDKPAILEIDSLSPDETVQIITSNLRKKHN